VREMKTTKTRPYRPEDLGVFWFIIQSVVRQIANENGLNWYCYTKSADNGGKDAFIFGFFHPFGVMSENYYGEDGAISRKEIDDAIAEIVTIKNNRKFDFSQRSEKIKEKILDVAKNVSARVNWSTPSHIN